MSPPLMNLLQGALWQYIFRCFLVLNDLKRPDLTYFTKSIFHKTNLVLL